jgi:type VI secretion system secreted protein VgrG
MGAMAETLTSLSSTQAQSDQSIPTLGRPDLITSTPGAITSHTPAHTVISAGGQAAISTALDANLLSQRHTAWAVKDGISLFTRGEAKDAKHPVQDIGMKLHAASGNVNTQAQSGGITITAAKAIDIQSTTANITISAPSSLMLNGSGGYIKINGGDIEIGTSGAASFKASMKELAGGGSASNAPPLLPRPPDWHTEKADQFFHIRSHDGQPVANRRYRARTGNIQIDGFTDGSGKTRLLTGHVDQHAQIELVDERFDEHFVIRDSRGQSLANFPYVIRSSSGVELHGRTDRHGRTSLFTSDEVESLSLTYTAPNDFPPAEGVN